MGLRSTSNVISCFRGAFLILVAVAWAGNPALANRVFHMKRNVWGCVDPNVTPDLNDEAEPHRADPQWVARNKIEGQCVPISTRSLWEPLSADHDGLTYVAYRGATATPGSFWVPTRAIDFSTPVEVVPALAAPPPSLVTPPVSVAPPKVTAPLLPQPEATPTAPDDQAPTAEVPGPQPQPTPETVPSPSAEAPAAPSGGHMSSFLFVLAILFGTRVAWVILRKSRRAASPSAGSATNSRTVGSVQVPVSKVNARTALGVRQSAIWNGPGTAVSVAPGARILDGMVYVGSGGGRPGDHDASFIDPTLPVARSAASAGPLATGRHTPRSHPNAGGATWIGLPPGRKLRARTSATYFSTSTGWSDVSSWKSLLPRKCKLSWTKLSGCEQFTRATSPLTVIAAALSRRSASSKLQSKQLPRQGLMPLQGRPRQDGLARCPSL